MKVMQPFASWIAVLLLAGNLCNGQNLIPNPGFEALEIRPCDYHCKAGFACCFNFYSYPWKSVTLHGSPDVYATKPINWYELGDISKKNLRPQEGNVIIGASLGGEHFGVPLKQPLGIGKSYRLSFYVHASRTYSNALSVLFSEHPVQQERTILGKPIFNRAPTFKVKEVLAPKGWQKLTVYFTADKPYAHLIIGLFQRGGAYQHTTLNRDMEIIAKGKAGYMIAGYYYFDAFELVQMDAPKDTVRQWIDYRFSTQKVTIAFEKSSTEVRPHQQVQIKEFVEQTRYCLPHQSILIESHADNEGGHGFNQTLSDKRAAEVQKLLTEIHEIDPKNITVKSFGETQNLGMTDALFRKVVLRIIEKPSISTP